MQLIDATVLEKEAEESLCANPHTGIMAQAMHTHEHKHFLCMIAHQPTIDPETLPIVRQLREELARVTAERDAAQRLLAEHSGVVGMKKVTTCFGCPLDRVLELVTADKERRCIIFRFGIGQTVYRAWIRPDGTHPFVSEEKLKSVQDLINAELWSDAYKTREAAEAALAKSVKP